MNEERWEQLVRRLERKAHEDPGGYRRRVATVAALGYAYLGLALLVLAALAGLVVWLVIHHPGPLIKLLFPILAVAWIVVRSLAVRIEPPGGVPLRRGDAPELFRALEEVDRQVRGPKVHAVLLDGEMNAAVVQNPRLLGLLGRRNYLAIGLPLLQALSPEEFRAVLAHELAHLSRSHGRFGTWIYRVRTTWWQLLEALEARRSWGRILFGRFFIWYVPYFNAHAFPLLRAHEFEADRLAADAVGREELAHALVRLVVSDRFLATRYWPKLFERVADEPQPPQTAFAALEAELAATRRLPEARSWLDEELERPADPTDTHPSFAERLEALGIAREVALADGAGGETAAQRLLGMAEPELIERIDAEWRRSVTPTWLDEHRAAQEAKRRLEQLEAQDGLRGEEARERAQLAERFRRAEEALARWHEVLEREPDDAQAEFAVGRILLERSDEAGLEHLERAMKADPDAVLPACELAYGYLRERGRGEEAERYRGRGERQAELLGAALEERESVSVEDVLEPHGLPAELVERLRQKLAGHEEVEQAYLLRKHLEHLAEAHPLYVVGVVPRRSRRARREDEDSEPLPDRLARELDLPGEVIVATVGRKSPLAQRFAQVEGARIFSA